MSILPPSVLTGVDNVEESTFTMEEVVPDPTYSLFGKHSPERSYRILLKGLIHWKSSVNWCQAMPSTSVRVPTLYKPLNLQLNIVKTIDEANEEWVGFFLKVEDICALKSWDTSQYFTLKIKTPYGQKRARYIKYTAAANCWGWFKIFKLNVMLQCDGNPFIMEIILEHETMPCIIYRFPMLSLSEDNFEKSVDDVEDFHKEWDKIRFAEEKKSIVENPASMKDHPPVIARKPKKKSRFRSSASAEEIRPSPIYIPRSQSASQETIRGQNHHKNRSIRKSP